MSPCLSTISLHDRYRRAAPNHSVTFAFIQNFDLDALAKMLETCRHVTYVAYVAYVALI